MTSSGRGDVLLSSFMNIFCATIGGVNLVDKAYDNERI
ncbi:hypothetical protein AB895_2942 [Acinetobacter baumannii]|uniref:Uncharacterized protein n=1 Tax=Acinetobacter baumannii 625974 TaxID=1310607 RepID=A0A009Q067_ACIBA|nr:hypothetical protein J506_1444 [Acinetobacter baumannii 625974]EXR83249.1 hypothetical protein J685_1395 [Acinetobacter baumannii 541915]KMV05041.1 hypothetical protein AB895_2942 [Acinetobacter baumannii]